MAAIIDSAPDCVTRNEGGENFAEDGADFILQDNYAGLRRVRDVHARLDLR